MAEEIKQHKNEKLGEAGGYIETVRGVGYRFTPASDHAAAIGRGGGVDEDEDA